MIGGEIMNESILDYDFSVRCKKYTKIPKTVLYRISGTLDSDMKAALSRLYRNESLDSNIRLFENEKSRYGKTLRLPKNAIKVLLLLYFYGAKEIKSGNNHTKGLIQDVSIHSILHTLHITKKNLRKSMMCLQDNRLLVYSGSVGGDSRYMNIILNDYTMNEKANRGGRGYVDVDHTIMANIINNPSVNSLRIYLRLLLKQEEYTRSHINQDGFIVNVNELKCILPKYMRRGDILAAIDKLPERPIIKKNTHMRIQLQSHDIKLKLQEDLDKANYILSEYIDEFNHNVKKTNIHNRSVHLPPVPEIHMASDVILSIARNVVNYGMAAVKVSINRFYNQYVKKEHPTGSIAAIIQSLIYQTIDDWELI